MKNPFKWISEAAGKIKDWGSDTLGLRGRPSGPAPTGPREAAYGYESPVDLDAEKNSSISLLRRAGLNQYPAINTQEDYSNQSRALALQDRDRIYNQANSLGQYVDRSANMAQNQALADSRRNAIAMSSTGSPYSRAANLRAATQNAALQSGEILQAGMQERMKGHMTAEDMRLKAYEGQQRAAGDMRTADQSQYRNVLDRQMQERDYAMKQDEVNRFYQNAQLEEEKRKRLLAMEFERDRISFDTNQWAARQAAYNASIATGRDALTGVAKGISTAATAGKAPGTAAPKPTV